MCMDPKYVRGTCLKYRKGDASWVVCTESRGDDPEAIVGRDEFKTLAWTTANAKARRLRGSQGATRRYPNVSNVWPRGLLHGAAEPPKRLLLLSQNRG